MDQRKITKVGKSPTSYNQVTRNVKYDCQFSQNRLHLAKKKWGGKRKGKINGAENKSLSELRNALLPHLLNDNLVASNKGEN